MGNNSWERRVREAPEADKKAGGEDRRPAARARIPQLAALHELTSSLYASRTLMPYASSLGWSG
jgi:hypothetical protein